MRPPIRGRVSRLELWKAELARRLDPAPLLRRFDKALLRFPNLATAVRDVHLHDVRIHFPRLQSLVAHLVNLRELHLDDLLWVPAPSLMRPYRRPRTRRRIDRLILGKHTAHTDSSSVPELLDALLLFDRCGTLQITSPQRPSVNFLRRDPDFLKAKVNVHALVLYDQKYLDELAGLVEYETCETVRAYNPTRWTSWSPSYWQG